MPWFIFAILSTIFFAICFIVDKFILEKIIKNFLAYFVASGFICLLFIALVLLFAPLPKISLTTILLAILTGFLTAGTWLLFFKALTKEEVSRIIAIYCIYPIFVVLLARIFLKEEISSLKLLGIILAILGAILISLKRETFTQKLKLSSAFFIILAAGFLEATLEVLDKYVLYSLSSLNLIVFSYFGLFMVALTFFISSKNIRKDVIQIFTKPSTLRVVFSLNFIYFLAVIFYLSAISFTLVSYVTSISVSQPLFVFLFAIILSLRFPRFLEEPLDKKTILVKIFSIILSISGILIVILT